MGGFVPPFNLSAFFALKRNQNQFGICFKISGIIAQHVSSMTFAIVMGYDLYSICQSLLCLARA